MLLVMVNIAFPYKETDASAMNMALNVLQAMADRGNGYIRACHSLLAKIRSAIKPVQPKVPNPEPNGQTEDQIQGDDTLSQSSTLIPELLQDDTQPLSLDFEDDPVLWAEVLDSMNIDMDRQWVETALRKGQQLEAGPHVNMS